MLFLFRDNTIPCLTVISFCFALPTNKITLLTGRVCDEFGNYSIPKDAPPPPPPPPRPSPAHDDWTPYTNRVEFETAEFLYCKTQMSADNIDALTNLWAATLLPHADSPPFANHSDLYETIDSTPVGDVLWQSFSITYDGKRPANGDMPDWMLAEHEVWFRDPHILVKNMLANPDYKAQIDYAPVQEFNDGGSRRYQNFMSGDWAWEQAVRIHILL